MFVERSARIIVCLAAALGLAVLPHSFSARAQTPSTKPVIQGFIDMGTITWHNTNDTPPTPFTLDNVNTFPGMFGGVVFNGTWNEMQPHPRLTQPNQLITERLDAALNLVSQYNDAHPTAPLGVKLRIWSGNQAPHWAKALAGGPVRIRRNSNGCQAESGGCRITVGKVWEQPYIAAWRAFQQALAQRYDSEPLIRSVAITSCTMETDEPFVLPTLPPLPEGYTDAAGRDCLRHAVDDYAGWVQTPIDYAINTFLDIQEHTGPDQHFSVTVMNRCRAKLGARCELGNHAFSSAMTPENLKMVRKISAQGQPIHYQTVGPKKNHLNWNATARKARLFNATALELWPDAQFGGFTTLTPQQMRHLLALFNGSL
jgi:hypothetical protein